MCKFEAWWIIIKLLNCALDMVYFLRHNISRYNDASKLTYFLFYLSEFPAILFAINRHEMNVENWILDIVYKLLSFWYYF